MVGPFPNERHWAALHFCCAAAAALPRRPWQCADSLVAFAASEHSWGDRGGAFGPNYWTCSVHLRGRAGKSLFCMCISRVLLRDSSPA